MKNSVEFYDNLSDYEKIDIEICLSRHGATKTAREYQITYPWALAIARRLNIKWSRFELNKRKTQGLTKYFKDNKIEQSKR